MANLTLEDVLRKAITNYIKAGGTLNSLGKEAGVDYAALHRWWNGDRDLRLSTFSALSAALKIKFSLPPKK